MSTILPPQPDKTSDVSTARPVMYPLGYIGPPRVIARLSIELPWISRRQAALGVLLVLFVGLISLAGTPLALAGISFVYTNTQGYELFSSKLAFMLAAKWIGAILVILAAYILIQAMNLRFDSFGVTFRNIDEQIVQAILGVFLVYVAMFATGIIIFVILLYAPVAAEDIANRVAFADHFADQMLWHTLLLMLAVAIQEELLFRGMLIPYLRRIGCAWWAAILLSSALFAVLHIDQGWLAVPQLFVVALVLGALFVRTRSLITVTVTHLVLNVFQVQLMKLLPLQDALELVRRAS